MASKHASFQGDWLTDSLFSSWLERVPNNTNSAKCKLCYKTFSLSNMGRRAVISHMQSKKHASSSNASSQSSSMKMFLSSPPVLKCSLLTPVETIVQETTELPVIGESGLKVAPNCHTTLSSESLGPRGLKTFIFNENVSKAEILWTIQSVITHKSLRTAGRDVSIFSKMFPDSEIAKRMQLQRDKIGYLIAYGVGPYFSSELIKCIIKCEFVVLGFDESLNKVAQKQQFDVNVRFWCKETNEVKTRYLNSVFLGRASAADISVAFKEATRDISPKKILQVSMDGPYVNYKFLREFKEELKVFSENQLLNIGSCGLHTV